MLRFTKEAEYGLLALSYIASRPQGELAYRKEIAEHHNIPREFLAKVLQKLSRQGLIKSYRGIRGGYLIARPPAEISLADVVRAVDGPMALVECAQEDGECPQQDVCTFRGVLWDLQGSLQKLLEGITMDDVLKRAGAGAAGGRNVAPAEGAPRKGGGGA